jgi:hypothetical protein
MGYDWQPDGSHPHTVGVEVYVANMRKARDAHPNLVAGLGSVSARDESTRPFEAAGCTNRILNNHAQNGSRGDRSITGYATPLSRCFFFDSAAREEATPNSQVIGSNELLSVRTYLIKIITI